MIKQWTRFWLTNYWWLVNEYHALVMSYLGIVWLSMDICLWLISKHFPCDFYVSLQFATLKIIHLVFMVYFTFLLMWFLRFHLVEPILWSRSFQFTGMKCPLFAVFLLTICVILVEPAPRQIDEADAFFRDWVLVRRKPCKPNWAECNDSRECCGGSAAICSFNGKKKQCYVY